MIQTTISKDEFGNTISSSNTVTTEPKASVEIRQGAKGCPSITVKCYGVTGAEASAEAVEVYKQTLAELA